MELEPRIERILDKALNEQDLTRADALELMHIELASPEMYALCGVANTLSRRDFDQAEIYAQIGLDYAPCPSNCEFCSFGARHELVRQAVEYPLDEIICSAKRCEEQGANGIYLMTTARYRLERYLEVIRAVRRAVSPRVPLVVNTADFNEEQAQAFAAAGVQASYHAVRLNEGHGTPFSPARRIQTIQAAQRAGLAAHFCIEPIGPEHSVEQQVELMFLGRELGVTFSGAMRRVALPGTPVAGFGEIGSWELARVVAVSRLVMGHTVRAHCTHEPNVPSLLAGANLLWAEMGPNPRDVAPDTENHRGLSVRDCQGMLREAGWQVRRGPAISATAPASQVERSFASGV